MKVQDDLGEQFGDDAGRDTQSAGKYARQQAAQMGESQRTIGAPVRFWRDELLGRQIGGQGIEIVADHFGAYVLTRCKPGQAGRMLERTALAEGVHAMPEKPVLHGDNGSTLKASTVQAMLRWLGVKPSYSRPRVSDDNAFVESLFKTAKYRPESPVRGFADLEAARIWGHDFVRWYNLDHRHSGIRYVTTAQRHAGEYIAILAARHQTYLQARKGNPARWSKNTRNWSPIGAVTLNPERDAVIRDHVRAENKTRLVA